MNSDFNNTSKMNNQSNGYHNQGQNYQQYPSNNNYDNYNGNFPSGYGNYPPNNPNRQDGSNKVIIVIIVIATVIILGLCGFLAYFLLSDNDANEPTTPITTTVETTEPTTEEETTQEPTVEVPNVEGLSAEDAYQKLNDAGVKYTISRQNSETVQNGYVISQNPKNGNIKASEKVTLYVSKGSNQPQTNPVATAAPATRAASSNNNNYSGSNIPSWSFDVNYPSNTFVLYGSDARYVTRSEVLSLGRAEMNTALNEIYARHGRKFKDSSIQSYFNSLPWYYGYIEPSTFDSNVSSYLNDIETANINLISQIQSELGYR